jgi:hypothetical protein
MNSLFQTRVLTEAINKIKPVKTVILNKVFGTKKFLPTGLFQWDIKSGSERILKNLRVHEPAQVASSMGKKTVTCNGTRFSEKRFIAAADLESVRAYGQNVQAELISAKIADEQVDMKAKVDRTREFMAAKAIQGTIVDDAGTTLVDFAFGGSQTPTLTGKSKWTDSESDPIANIRAWQKIIVQAVGEVDVFYAFCGSTAMDALIANKAVQELLKYVKGDQIAEKGRVAFLAGTEIEEILGSYLDSSSVRQDLIPANSFILVGVSMQTASELYAPVVDLKDANGVGSANPASMFFSKSWEEEDPSGRWIKVEARPLPILYKPECIVKAIVR